MNRDIVIISENTQIINAVTTALNGQTPIVLSSFRQLKAESEKRDINVIVFDATNEGKEAIENALLIISNHNYTPILLIVNPDFGAKLKAEKINEMYWCVSPCDIIKLSAKIEKLKKATTTITRDLNLINTIMTKAPFGIALIRNNDPKKSIYNETIEFITGLNKKQFIAQNIIGLPHSEKDRDVANNENDKYTITTSKKFKRKDGHTGWAEMYILMLDFVDEQNFTALVLTKDVEEQKVAKEKLAEANKSRAILLNSMPGIAYRSKRDALWTMEYMSDGALTLTGYKAEDFVNNHQLVYNDIIVPKYRKYVEQTLDQACRKKHPYEMQYEIVTINKEHKWVLERGECVVDQSGNTIAVEGVIFDINELKKLEQALKYKSEFDENTQLPNLQNLIARCEETPQKDKKEKTIITINLNEIARLSATYGYKYMLEFRNKIVNKLRDIEINQGELYLIQETQVAYVFNRTLSDGEIKDLFDKIVLRLGGTLRREVVKCGVGVYLSKEKSEDVEVVINRAFVASERAMQDENLINLRYYDDKIADDIIREKVICKELQSVIDHTYDEGLYLHYQPIYLAKTMKIIAFEALARFESKVYGKVPPLEFIPIAEKNRISIVLGRRIILTAMKFLKRMHSAGYGDARVTINISINQLLDWFFLVDLDQFTKDLDVDQTKITFEITEHIYEGNYEKINKVVNELRARGVRVAMDDFGTGFSSLGLLEKINLTTIKIDREFVKSLDYVTKDRSIIQDIVKMANRLGMAIVAEGVETNEQKEILTEFNCHMLQGYYLSRPVDEETAFKMLVDDRKP